MPKNAVGRPIVKRYGRNLPIALRVLSNSIARMGAKTRPTSVAATFIVCKSSAVMPMDAPTIMLPAFKTISPTMDTIKYTPAPPTEYAAISR